MHTAGNLQLHPFTWSIFPYSKISNAHTNTYFHWAFLSSIAHPYTALSRIMISLFTGPRSASSSTAACRVGSSNVHWCTKNTPHTLKRARGKFRCCLQSGDRVGWLVELPWTSSLPPASVPTKAQRVDSPAPVCVCHCMPIVHAECITRSKSSFLTYD